MIEIVPENPARHAAAVEALYDATFGPGHFAKTAERVREGTVSLPALSRVAMQEGRLVAACRIWPLEVGEACAPAIFVGPVAVDPESQGQRLGLKVTEASLQAARAAGWNTAIIIGAPTYFGELGFEVVSKGDLVFPGPQDPARIMALALEGGAALPRGAVKVPANPHQYL